MVVSVTPGPWSRVLRDRGLRAPGLVVADGHVGIWGAVRNR